ncbi:hypothetical protein XENOCAPTIV_027284, partial [Xenoophorus captivus]
TTQVRLRSHLLPAISSPALVSVIGDARSPLTVFQTRTYEVMICSRLAALSARFSRIQVPVRSAGRSHGSSPEREALKTGEGRRQQQQKQQQQQPGCRASQLGMEQGRFATRCPRSRRGGINTITLFNDLVTCE